MLDKFDTPSSDHQAMCGYWDMVTALMGGAETMRAAGKAYLPKFVNESEADYELRRKNAKFTNIFRDIVESLAAKPFSKEVKLKNADADAQIETFIEDVDARGNHLHVFASSLFFEGIKSAVQWVLVDYNGDMNSTASLAAQKANGVRPYWVSISPSRLLAAYSAMIDGKEQFYHVRIKEDVIEIEDGLEVPKERIRILERPYLEGKFGAPVWRLMEKQAVGAVKTSSWAEIKSGTITIGVIPLVPFITGRRKEMTWQFDPALRDAADLQVELYQQESGMKYAKESAAFPMLAANGVEPPMNPDGKTVASIPVGPKAVLFAPPYGDGNHGEWTFIEPDATSLRFLADDIKETIAQLRELGRQPLTAQTGNLTVVTTMFAADKANTVIQAWALNLKDALENALRFTALWMKLTYEPEVEIFTDFDIGLSDDKGPETLAKARETGDLSQKTYWEELQRRNILGPNFSADEEEIRLESELPGDPSEQDLMDAGTDAGNASARAGKPNPAQESA